MREAEIQEAKLVRNQASTHGHSQSKSCHVLNLLDTLEIIKFNSFRVGANN